MTAKAATSLLALVAVLACLDIEKVSTPPVSPPPPGSILPPQGSARRSSISAALHLHGWSNHSGSVFPASMAWHTAQAAAAGVDVLWWTDHADVYAGRVPDFVVTPSRPTQIGRGLWTVGKWFGGGAQAFVSSSAGSLTTFAASGSRLTASLPPGDTSVTDTVTLFFARLVVGVPRRAPFLTLARPLVGNPRFAMAVWRDPATGHFPALRITVPLAWHPRGPTGYRPVLRYRFGTSTKAGLPLFGDTAEYTRSWADSDSTQVVLTPKSDASVFSDGLDNTTDEYRAMFTVQRAAGGANVQFAFPVVANADSSAAVQMPPAVATAQATGNAYGVRVLWGTETGGSDPALTASQWANVSGGGAHMVVYLPVDVNPAFVEKPHGTLSQAAGVIRALGGVSWGDMGLREHMYLLDYLLRSGVRMCGVGASDSHGQRMLPDPTSAEEQDNFVTWIADVNRASPVSALLSSMRNCQLSFGNPFYVRGGLWVHVVTDSVGRQHLDMDATGVSPSAQYYLYEAWGVAVILFALVLDAADGNMARTAKRFSPFGEWLEGIGSYLLCGGFHLAGGIGAWRALMARAPVTQWPVAAVSGGWLVVFGAVAATTITFSILAAAKFSLTFPQVDRGEVVARWGGGLYGLLFTIGRNLSFASGLVLPLTLVGILSRRYELVLVGFAILSGGMMLAVLTRCVFLANRATPTRSS